MKVPQSEVAGRISLYAHCIISVGYSAATWHTTTEDGAAIKEAQRNKLGHVGSNFGTNHF